MSTSMYIQHWARNSGFLAMVLRKFGRLLRLWAKLGHCVRYLRSRLFVENGSLVNCSDCGLRE